MNLKIQIKNRILKFESSFAERYARCGECKSTSCRSHLTLDFEGRRFYITEAEASILFGPIKFMNVFNHIFSDYDAINAEEKLEQWFPDEAKTAIYFHPWKPNQTEDVDDEAVMLECYLADQKNATFSSDEEI